MFLNSIRRVAFFSLDFVKGNRVKRHYKEIISILGNPNQEVLGVKGNTALKELFFHATTTTEFYKPYSGVKELENFPVISKTLVQENFQAFKSIEFLNSKTYKVSTSGSTGVPFFLFQDMNKRKRNMADLIYYYNKVGHKLGNKLYEFEVWRSHNKKGRFKSFIQNVFQFDVSKLNKNRINKLLQILKNDKAPKAFLGFASAYETICQYLEHGGINDPFDFNIRCIIANSEYLNDYTRNNMGKYFNAPVYSRYSNEEIGLIAQQIEGSDKDFIINWASYYVELLEFDSDKPAEIGKPGRIVITDLFNYCMPLIRFDTGDIGVFTEPKNGQLPNFKQIEGRKMDLIYDTSGKLISSFVVYTKFYNYYKLLKQYQFIQCDRKEYVIKLNLVDSHFKYEEELISAIKEDFGEDAQVKIEYVDEIPPLSSGKRKKVLNLYQQKKSDS